MSVVFFFVFVVFIFFFFFSSRRRHTRCGRDWSSDVCSSDLMDADILFVGSSTINRNALPTIWNFLAGVNAFAMSGKLAGVFGSYGWSGEAVPQIKSYLTNLRCKVVGDGLKILFNPSTNDLSKAKEYAQELVEAFVASK